MQPTDFNAFSILGMEESELFLSEKDLKATKFNSLSKPTSGFQQKQEEIKEEKSHIKLEIKIPPPKEIKSQEEEEDGFRTPTSLDQKIPLILKCPPAPRKPKPNPSTKRKALLHQHRIAIDVSKEIESLFPPVFLMDLGGKIKKNKKDFREYIYNV